MNVPITPSLLFLVLLSCMLCSSGMAAPLRAAGSPLQKLPTKLASRTRRFAPSDQDLANIPGPRFIVDLFKNLTNSSTPQFTQANTIRAMPYLMKSESVLMRAR